MKRILLISLVAMFCCISEANAGIPMPDGLRKLIEKIEVFEDKLATFQKDVMEVYQEVMQAYTEIKDTAMEAYNEVKGIYDQGKALYDQGKGMYEEGKALAEGVSSDPLGSTMQFLEGNSSAMQSRNGAKSLRKTLGFSSNLTNEEFQAKMKIVGDLKRKHIADTYASAFVRRMELLDEVNEEKDETKSIGNQQEPLKDQSYVAAEIAMRGVSMIVFEAMAGHVYYITQYANFSHDEEDAE